MYLPSYMNWYNTTWQTDPNRWDGMIPPVWCLSTGPTPPPPTSPFLSPRTCMYTNLSYFRDEGVLSGLHLIQQLLSLALHLFETSLIVRLYLPGCLGGWTMRVTMVTSQHHIQVPIAPTYNEEERVTMVTNWHHQVPLR